MNKKNKKIIAVVGMAGSGKSEAVNYLVKKLQCAKVYFGEPTFEWLKEENLKVNYANEKIIRERIRKELGMGAYATLALPKIKKCLETSNIVILESLYSWEEYKIIKNKFVDNFTALAIFASPKTRFTRLTIRKNERPMANIKEFITRDYSEIENTQKGGPIARADFTIINESDIVNLHNKLNNLPIFK